MSEIKSESTMLEQFVPIEKQESHTDDSDVVGFTTNADNLPKGYYTSTSFLGSMLATGLGLNAGVAGYGLPAPVLGVINQDIGPDPDLIWVALGYSLTLAVGLTLFGRLSDIFGRRWCCIGGAILGLVGCIIGATAQSIHQLIGASAIIGLGGAAQLSFHFIIGELVPMKFRFVAIAGLFVFCIPASGLAPAIANAIIVNTSVGWRGIYYLLIAVNGGSLICYGLFYHPPNFRMKHRNESRLQWIKHLDFGGIVLYTCGLLLLLLGLSWGGTVYPWKSAHVIATIVVGVGSLVAFGLYESYVPLKEPLVPMHLFKNVPWVASIVLLGLGAGVYYALALVWPSLVAVEYANGDAIYGGLLSSLHGSAIISGQIVGGLLAKPLGRVKLQATITYAIGGIILACIATSTPETKSRAVGLLYGGCFFIGWAEMLGLGLSTIACNNQQEIGIAGGVAGSIRSALGTIATAVYSSVLSNRLKQTIPARVPPALIGAGLPASSVPSFIAAIPTGQLDAVPGVSQAIIAAGINAYKWANSDAYSTVFLASIAFTCLGLMLCYWFPNVEKRMTNDVVATLHQRNTEKVIGEQAV